MDVLRSLCQWLALNLGKSNMSMFNMSCQKDTSHLQAFYVSISWLFIQPFHSLCWAFHASDG